MCIDKVKMFLLEPTKSFKKETGTSLGDVFRHFLKLAAVLAALTGAVAGAVAGSASVFAIVAVGSYVATVIGTFLGGLILHVFAYLYGARRGVEQTLKAVFLGMTPYLLLGWIPLIGGLAALWTLVLEILGLKILQKMSTTRAVLAMATPAVIIGLMFLVGMLVFMAAILAGVGIPGFAGIGINSFHQYCPFGGLCSRMIGI